jgi:hypothetical protein
LLAYHVQHRADYLPAHEEADDSGETDTKKPLPLGTAILSNVALSLLMWNIVLRVVGLILAT